MHGRLDCIERDGMRGGSVFEDIAERLLKLVRHSQPLSLC